MRSFLYSLVAITSFGNLSNSSFSPPDPSDCSNLEIVFARGTNEKLDDLSVQVLRKSIADAFDDSKITYHISELGEIAHGGFRYPASNIDHFVGTYLSAGTAYKLGESIDQGIGELKAYVSELSQKCPSTKFALVGYSQGAAVITRTLDELDSSRIVYVANISDPKLYLPEGEGLSPPACRNEQLSEYRILVEDCHVSAGILGAKKPYISKSYQGKVGTWCNQNDPICGSSVNWTDFLGAHVTYRKLGRYKDVAEHIFERAKKTNFVSNPTKPSEAKPKPAPSKSSDILILFDYKAYSPSSVTSLAVKLTDLQLPSSTNLDVYLYNNSSGTLNSDYLGLNPYFSSRLSHLSVENVNLSLAGTAHQIWLKNQDLDYGTSPRIVLVERNSTRELSGEDFMRLVNSFVYNTNPDSTSPETSEPDFVEAIVPATATTINLSPHVVRLATENISRTTTDNTSQIARNSASQIATNDASQISLDGVHIENTTITFTLNLSDNSSGTLIFLNDYLIGAASREELAKTNNTITISDFNPSIENILIIKSVDSSGRMAETFGLTPNFQTSQANQTDQTNQGNQTDQANQGNQTDQANRADSELPFPLVKTPDCGVPKRESN